MSYPRTGNTGKTGVQRSANPNRRQGDTMMPPGSTSSRITRQDSGPRARPGGSAPDREGGTGYTTRGGGGSPSPVNVESGRKITRIEEP